MYSEKDFKNKVNKMLYVPCFVPISFCIKLLPTVHITGKYVVANDNYMRGTKKQAQFAVKIIPTQLPN